MEVALVHKRLSQVGGLETRLKNYIDFFHDRGDHVSVFCYKQDRSFQVPEGVEVRRVNLGAMPKPYRSWYFNHKLNRIFRKEDFDFSLALGRTSQQYACLAPGDHLGYLKASRKIGRKPIDLVQINLDKLSFRQSQLIFPCSDLVKSNLIELYQVPEEKMHVLFPPLDTSRFNTSHRENRNEYRVKYGMSPDKISFVAVSTSHRRKGIPLLLKVFKELQDLPIELIVAGKTKPRVRRNTPENVHFAGYVKRPEELFSAADFCIHPAIYEPFGQVISESLACGTPAIISKNTGWSASLPKTAGMVVDQLDLASWTAAIREALQKKFEIPTDFADQHQLSLQHHMEKMLAIYFANQ